MKCPELKRLKDERDDLTQAFQHTLEDLKTQFDARLSQDKGALDPEDFPRKAGELAGMQSGAVLIYPLVLPDKLWLLWGAAGGVTKAVAVRVTQEQLEQAAVSFRQLLESPVSDILKLNALGAQFYGWLIRPIEAELEANKIDTLIFSLDRVIRYLPMSALWDGKHYLMERYTVWTIPSADLTDTQDRLPTELQQTPVLALGLSEAKAGFKPLPYVPAELDTIVQRTGIYPGDKILNAAFDYPALRDHVQGRKILHIATHGAFLPGAKDNSFLLLGSGDKLTLPEINNLRELRDVHLVVLSVCQTALGTKGQDGVEINAMSYYFLNNGVKAVMASLWAVDDSSTSQLMRKFYSELATAKVTKAQALRQAQLALLKDHGSGRSEARGVERTEDTAKRYDHPYYWAPFILMGNWL